MFATSTVAAVHEYCANCFYSDAILTAGLFFIVTEALRKKARRKRMEQSQMARILAMMILRGFKYMRLPPSPQKKTRKSNTLRAQS